MATNAERFTVQYEGKVYTLRPRRLTGELLDTVQPIHNRIVARAQGVQLQKAVARFPKVLQHVELDDTGALTFPEENKGAVRAMLAESPELAQAIFAPTAKLETTPEGRALMFELIATTVDREALPGKLCEALDSEKRDRPAVPAKVDSDGVELEPEREAVQASDFWRGFDLETALGYCEFFLSRARL